MSVENLENKDYKIDVLKAARMCRNTWDQVTPETIANCFRKAGFCKNYEEFNDCDVNTTYAIDSFNMLEPQVSFEQFINVD